MGLAPFEQRNAHAEVLIVAGGWPIPERPMYGVFTKRQVESLAPLGVRCDVLFIRGYLSPLAYLVAALKLATLNFRARPYKLVHAHGGEAALAAWFYRRAPLVVSYLGDDLLGTPSGEGSIPKRGLVRRTLLRQAARLARATITKSREMELVLPRSRRARNTVIPNGVDRQRFHPRERDDARAALGWSSDRIALFVGDPALPRKRYWLASAACDRAARVLTDLRLEVADNVDPDRIPLMLNAADCLLLTSSIEGSPNVVKEALGCNLPVVTTRVGDVEELLAGVQPSYICDSEEELADALVRCLSDVRRSNGSTVSAHLALERVAERVVTLYRSVAPISVSTASASAERVWASPSR